MPLLRFLSDVLEIMQIRVFVFDRDFAISIHYLGKYHLEDDQLNITIGIQRRMQKLRKLGRSDSDFWIELWWESRRFKTFTKKILPREIGRRRDIRIALKEMRDMIVPIMEQEG